MNTKKKRKIRTLSLKNQAVIIVALMIFILSAVFFYNIIKFNKKEIKNINEIYNNLVKNFYDISKKHIPRVYRSAKKRLLSVPGLKEALAKGDRDTLKDLTEDFFRSMKKGSHLREINWYFPGNPGILRTYDAGQYITLPTSTHPFLPLNQPIKIEKEIGGFFVGENGITYRSIAPVSFQDNDPSVGALEFVVGPEYFFEDIKRTLKLESVLFIINADNDNVKRLKLSNNLNWKKIGKDHCFNINSAANPGKLRGIIPKIDMKAAFTEVNFDNKIYLVHNHFDLKDYREKPLATVVSIQDITALKEGINRSIYMIIFVTIASLIVVFLILYYSFGKLMRRLVERENQLETVNKGLETKIAERKAIEEKLNKHRGHLEELIAEGIRELERKSREIETNEKKLRTITSSIQDAIVMLDHKGNISFWNDAAERIFGYSRLEIKGKNFFKHIVPTTDYGKFIKSIEESYGKTVEMECKRKNGESFPAELGVSEVEIQGKSNVIALLRDITGKKGEETEKRILLRAVEQSSAGIEISDTDGIIQYVNPKFTEITGYEKEEVVGKSRDMLKSDFNPEKKYKHLWETITSGNDWQGELHNKKKNGDLYWELSLISPIKGQDGNITHFVTIKEDISERKNMEDELLSAKESAEAASRSKGEFLANVSHEIRTPMNAIMGMTELALGTKVDEEQREYLETVQQASRSLLKLLNDILDFSKVDADKLILEPAAFSLRKTLGETTRTLAAQAHKKDLELVYCIDSEVPDQLIGDAGRLRQIIVNLIGNSIKFTKQGEIVLKIEVLEEGLEEKVLLHFVVSDTGIGISVDQMEIIFDKFSQADSSTTREYGGTGLGLAISARLIELMGGIIWAESPSTFPHSNKKGPGSTFHFTTLFETNKEPSVLEKQAEIEKLKDLSLLIVDDNETNRKFLQDILSKYGLKPDTAGSGEEAFEILQSPAVPFQLLILDYRMPGMDGGTLLKKIRQELKSDIPVILLTSGIKADDLSEFRAAGAAAHLLKPIDSGELLETILVVLGHKPVTDKEKQALIAGEREEEKNENPPLRILVAEDNVINQRLIKRLLEKRGDEVEIARDGKETIEMFIKKAGNPQEKFDLILMDIQMPNMDGVEATRQIRKIHKKIPIIALTAHAMKGDKEKFLSAGMDDYISKPIEKNKLFEIIDTYVHKVP